MNLVVKRLLTILVLCMYLTVSRPDEAAIGIDSSVGSFSSLDKSAVEVFEDLARHAHVTIGVSGFVVAGHKREERKVSIDVDGKSLREVLDAICRQDLDYKWRQFSDHGIDVRLGPHPLTLTDVPIVNLSMEDVSPPNVLGLVFHLPEVKLWEQTNGCRVGHPMIINGNPRSDTGWTVTLKLHNKPFWKILNDLSVKSQSYFWSAIGSSGSSCYVFLDIPNGN